MKPEDQLNESGELLQNVTLKIPFPESYQYVNCAAFALSQMEIRLGFGEAMQDGTVVSKGGIVMPAEAAAVIALVLLKQVQKYEDSFGEIRHPVWKAMKAGKSVRVKDGIIQDPTETTEQTEAKSES